MKKITMEKLCNLLFTECPEDLRNEKVDFDEILTHLSGKAKTIIKMSIHGMDDKDITEIIGYRGGTKSLHGECNRISKSIFYYLGYKNYDNFKQSYEWIYPDLNQINKGEKKKLWDQYVLSSRVFKYVLKDNPYISNLLDLDNIKDEFKDHKDEILNTHNGYFKLLSNLYPGYKLNHLDIATKNTIIKFYIYLYNRINNNTIDSIIIYGGMDPFDITDNEQKDAKIFNEIEVTTYRDLAIWILNPKHANYKTDKIKLLNIKNIWV